MSYFVIKHLPTGYYLPNTRGSLSRGGRGFTHVEPSPNIPRLFAHKQDARRALSWWLKGAVTVSHVQTDNPSIGPDFYEDWNVKPVADRKAEDMRVVEVTLQEKQS